MVRALEGKLAFVLSVEVSDEAVPFVESGRFIGFVTRGGGLLSSFEVAQLLAEIGAKVGELSLEMCAFGFEFLSVLGAKDFECRGVFGIDRLLGPLVFCVALIEAFRRVLFGGFQVFLGGLKAGP
jgi:hypothetical protein